MSSVRKTSTSGGGDGMDSSKIFCPSFCPEDESLYEITSTINNASFSLPISSSCVESSTSTHGSSRSFRKGSLVSETSSAGSTGSPSSHTPASNPLFPFPSPILKSDHRVCLIPVNNKSCSELDSETLRQLCSGTYALHLEEETGRSAIVFVILEQSLSLLIWCRGSTTGFKAIFSQREFSSPSRQKSQGISHLFPKGLAYVSREMQERLRCLVAGRFDSCNKEHFLTGLEEGYIDLLYARQVAVSDSKIDLSNVTKRSGLKSGDVDCYKCLRLTYGFSMSDNRKVEFILPRDVCSVWCRGMAIILRELDKQKKLSDQRLLWLKLKYLQLYYSESKNYSYPTPAEAIKAFGGRRWVLSDLSTLPSSSIPFNSKEGQRGSFASSTSSSSRPSCSSIGSPSKIGRIIGAKGKLLKKKKSTPSFPFFSTESESHFGDKRTSSPPLPRQQHKYSISEEPFSRQNLRFSLRKVSARHSFSFLSHFRSRRASSSSSGDFIPPLLDPTNAITHQHLVQSLRKSPPVQDDPTTTTSTSSAASRTSEMSSHHPSTSDETTKASPSAATYHPLSSRKKPPLTSSLLSKDVKRGRGGWFGSQKNLLTSFDGSPSSATQGKIDPVKHMVRQSITHSSTLNFIEFKELYRSFLIRSRADIKDLFEKLCQASPTSSDREKDSHDGRAEYFESSEKAITSTSTVIQGSLSTEHPTLTVVEKSEKPDKKPETTSSEKTLPLLPFSPEKSLESCSVKSHQEEELLRARLNLPSETREQVVQAEREGSKSEGYSSNSSWKQTTSYSPSSPEERHFHPLESQVRREARISSHSMTLPAGGVSVSQSQSIAADGQRLVKESIPSIMGISTVFESMSMSSSSKEPPYQVITTVSRSLSLLSGEETTKSPVMTPSPTPSPTTTIVPARSSLGSSDIGEEKRPSMSSVISAESSRRGSLFQESSSLSSHHQKSTLQHTSLSQGQGSKSPKRRSSLAVGTLGATVSGVTLTSGLLTRNQRDPLDEKSRQRNVIWDAIASASIVANSTGIDTVTNNLVLNLDNFFTFLRIYQREEGLTLDQVKEIIQRHEPDAKLRGKNCLSFEGFACYLMDKENYAFIPEQNTYVEEELKETLSHYYMATSHNTYLTGHQLKGDSSVEMYSHVLKTGCRCVELDCWDGEDGFPVIYHGHTLTSKISFRKVIEAINEAAFATSPFPVILSLENHCSLPQQSKMAQIFTSVFADKLVTQFMFDSDFADDPRLPSPVQLKYKILIKNKKLRTPILPAIHHKIRQAMSGITTTSGMTSLQTSPATPSMRKKQPNRTDSLLSVDSSGSLNEDDDDESEDEDDDEDEDDLLSTQAVISSIRSVTSTSATTSPSSKSKVNPHRPPLRTEESSSSQEERSSSVVIYTSELPSLSGERTVHLTNEPCISLGPPPVQHRQPDHSLHQRSQRPVTNTSSGQKDSGRKSSQVAPELSDLVNYVQAVKFRGLFFDPTFGLITSRPPPPQQQQIKTVASTTSTSSLPQAKRSTGSGKKIPASQVITPVPATQSFPVTCSTSSPTSASITTTGVNSILLSQGTLESSIPSGHASIPSFTSVIPITCSAESSTVTFPSLPVLSTTRTTTSEKQTSPSSCITFPLSTPSTSTGTTDIQTENISSPFATSSQLQSKMPFDRSIDLIEKVKDSSSLQTDTQQQHQSQLLTSGDRNSKQYANPSAPCYQVPSLNEHTAKKLCRKSPLPVIAFTESQLMRSYPAGMRIDSSNFNPLAFWAFGLQMAAINYQTEDMGSAINTAFFEQNGSCGLIKKPPVMIDHNHVMFGRFNPWEKEFDGLYALDLTITVISGQYVCPETNAGSPLVEVELIGIPIDCNKHRTRIVSRNSFNPIFNDTFIFRVTFSDLAFLRFAVIDATSNHLTAQRIIPISCLKPGYRHVRLRSPANEGLATSTLFIYSSSQEEGIEVDVESTSNEDMGRNRSLQNKGDHFLPHGSSASSSIRETPSVPASVPTRRRMFFLVIYGVVAEEPSTILKITQDSTTREVIAQALIKGNKPFEKEFDYVLIEEVAPTWNKKQLLKKQSNSVQRILDPEERPLEAQAKWKGEGRFVLKKISDDPSTRAWMSTIKAATIRKERILRREESENVDEFSSWNDDHLDNFLVCIYSVSPDQPYTILKAASTSTAQEIIQRALVKARRIEDSQNYVILEEVEHDIRDTTHHHSHHYSPSKPVRHIRQKRVLADDDVLFEVQSKWTSKGLFRLVPRAEASAMIEKDLKPKTLIRWAQTAKGSFKKMSRMSSYARSKESSTDRDSHPGKSDSLESQASSL